MKYTVFKQVIKYFNCSNFCKNAMNSNMYTALIVDGYFIISINIHHVLYKLLFY